MTVGTFVPGANGKTGFAVILPQLLIIIEVVQSHQNIFKVIKPFSKTTINSSHDLPTFKQ